MRTTVIAVAAAGLMGLAGQSAFADPTYRAADIIKHFSPDLGPTRGLCIGTESECAKSATPPPAISAKPFDLVVNFDYNSDVLTPGAKQNLDEFAKALNDSRLSTASFLVEGHTDARGSEGFNLNLSERRAGAVVRYLAEKGIDTSKLSAKGYGKLKPRTTNPFDPANRRVETRLRVN